METVAKHGTLLFVDDEPRVLTSMRSLFRRHYNVLLANNGQQALNVLKQQEVDVLISDQKMPGMSGDELLAISRSKFPKTIRLMMTGYIDSDSIEKSINQGEVFRFINKPWGIDELNRLVKDAVNASRAPVDEIEEQDDSVTDYEERFQEVLSAKSNLDREKSKAKILPQVLVMDRQEALLDQYKDMCEGMTSFVANSLEEALALVKEHPEIGIAIIDVDPTFDPGFKTVALLKLFKPHIVTIAMSSVKDSTISADLINIAQVFRIVEKPTKNTKGYNVLALAIRRYNNIIQNKFIERRYAADKLGAKRSRRLKKMVNSFSD